MQTRHVFGFTLLPLMLVVSATVIDNSRAWGSAATTMLPWFCLAAAVAILLLGIVCLVLQSVPTSVPPGVSAAVVAGTLIVVGIGMAIESNRRGRDWVDAASDWLGFGVVLAGVFWLARRRVVDRD
jgi:hypothetical protein